MYNANTADNQCHFGDATCKPIKGEGKFTLTMKKKGLYFYNYIYYLTKIALINFIAALVN